VNKQENGGQATSAGGMGSKIDRKGGLKAAGSRVTWGKVTWSGKGKRNWKKSKGKTPVSGKELRDTIWSVGQNGQLRKSVGEWKRALNRGGGG